jgi:putative endonuclease
VGYRRSPTGILGLRHKNTNNPVIPAQAGIQQGAAIKIQYSYVYIMASKRYGTLYIGVTSDLVTRVYEHKNDLVDGFTKKYTIHMLVYYLQFKDITEAILEEKRLKRWKREWKIKLIEDSIPGWRDLYGDII